MWSLQGVNKVQDDAVVQEYALAILSGNYGLGLGIALANPDLFEVTTFECGICRMEDTVITPPAARGKHPVPETCPLCTAAVAIAVTAPA